MSARVHDKTGELERYLDELATVAPSSFGAYQQDLKGRLACERLVEKIVEAAFDLAFLLIKEQGLWTAGDDDAALGVLARANVIDQALAGCLHEAKGMRNFLAHQYGKVDDKIVFEAITESLPKDMDAFIRRIRQAAPKK